jgi:CRISPR system Cascade subunit CasB
VEHLADILASDRLPQGERAVLRRMAPEQRPPLAFFRLACRSLPDNWEAQRREWMTLVAGIALMCPKPHRADRPAGQTLAEAGLSESRLERLLAAEGEGLSHILLRTAYFLGAKGVAINWTDLARLLLVTADRDERETIRIGIARDFYRPLDYRQRRN